MIARGGFGIVERVRLPSGLIAARKTFKPGPMVPPSDYSKLKIRFKREVQVQSRVIGPHIMPVLEHDLDAKTPWFVMPEAEGNYEQLITAYRKTGAGSIVDPLADILNGLEQLHTLGYAHRDLKPENVLYHEDKWKLSDFGLVLAPIGGTTRLTSRDSSWGTALYSAPEQSKSLANATPAADIYSFGCILHDIYAPDPDRVPYHRQTAPGPIGRIIEKCTEREPSKRFRDVRALRAVLLPLLATASPAAPPTATAQMWIGALPTISSWSADNLADFARFVENDDGLNQADPVFAELADSHLSALIARDEHVEAIALAYCDWAKRTGFPFAFCDVLIKRLEVLFTTSPSLTIKAAAALAAAEVGSSHNRWFVMGEVLDMCGPTLTTDVAERIAIEIQIDGYERQFRRCAEGISRSTLYYHPKIAAVLS